MKILRRVRIIRRRPSVMATDEATLTRFLRIGPNDRACGLDHLRGGHRSLNGW